MFIVPLKQELYKSFYSRNLRNNLLSVIIAESKLIRRVGIVFYYLSIFVLCTEEILIR